VIDLLVDNPLLLLFTVIAVGYPLGRLTFRGTSLGVASVLFAGIAIGSFDERLKLPEIVYQLGLVLFIYTVGLSNGRTFFASLRRRGLADGSFVLALVGSAAVLAYGASVVVGLAPAVAAGVFAGSLTNTPALAAILDYVEAHAESGALAEMLAEPVVAYSATYPMGVIGVILAIIVAQRIFRIDYALEATRATDVGQPPERLVNRTILITHDAGTSVPIRQLVAQYDWNVVFGRLRHDDSLGLVTAETRLAHGDLVSVIGTPEDVERVIQTLGEPSDERLEIDRAELDFRRVFVSDARVAGQRLRDLNLPQQYGAMVTRVRRGDVEFLASGDTTLELGDRVRVVTRRDNLNAVSQFFGDSYRALSEIDILTFSLGMAAGLAIGMVPIPLPGGASIELGLAGGPLIVALVLGAFERTGPLVWSLPYSANLTLRQMGLILFLAGIGTRAGYAFTSTLAGGDGLAILAVGAAITFLVAFLALWIGYRVLRVPMGVLLGMVAGLHTQPAVLGFALAQTGDDLPNVGYARIFPFASIIKIVVAQVLIAVLLNT
jgi:putative transport protein